MKVTTPSGEITTTTHIFSNLDLEIDILKMVANNWNIMISWDVDIILGMNWSRRKSCHDSLQERKKFPYIHLEKNQQISTVY